MPTAKLTKRSVDAFNSAGKDQAVLWDSEIRGFGLRALPSGLKTFIVQYRSAEGIKRRINLGRYGVITAEQARKLAKIKLGEVASGMDPAEAVHEARKGMTVAQMCDWYLAEARAGNILGRKNRPIKESSLRMDESRINTHIKPLLGKRHAKHLTIAQVEQMQSDIRDGKTARPRIGSRGGTASGGPGVAGRCLGTLQAILGHAKHKGLLDEHPTRGAKKLATRKRTRRLSSAELVALGKAMAFAHRNGENRTALAIVRLLVLTGFRREEGQSMMRSWVSPNGGFVAFPDTKSDAQVRAIGPEAIKVVLDQPVLEGNPYVFPSITGLGPYQAASACFRRLCGLARIEGATLHTLRHTFASIAAELGFTELTIRAMLGHASQNVTQDYIHIDEALRLAVRLTSDEIARLLKEGESSLRPLAMSEQELDL